MIKTLHLRIKDKHAKVLNALACEVNTVWNFDNELCYKHLQRTGKFFNGYDLHNYTKGLKQEGFKIHSATVQAINEEYCACRKQFKKAKLNWRTSFGARKSLGWVPFKSDNIRYING